MRAGSADSRVGLRESREKGPLTRVYVAERRVGGQEWQVRGAIIRIFDVSSRDGTAGARRCNAESRNRAAHSQLDGVH